MFGILDVYTFRITYTERHTRNASFRFWLIDKYAATSKLIHLSGAPLLFGHNESHASDAGLCSLRVLFGCSGIFAEPPLAYPFVRPHCVRCAHIVGP